MKCSTHGVRNCWFPFFIALRDYYLVITVERRVKLKLHLLLKRFDALTVWERTYLEKAKKRVWGRDLSPASADAAALCPFFFLGFDSIAGGQLSPWLNLRTACGKRGARRAPPAAPCRSAGAGAEQEGVPTGKWVAGEPEGKPRERPRSQAPGIPSCKDRGEQTGPVGPPLAVRFAAIPAAAAWAGAAVASESVCTQRS